MRIALAWLDLADPTDRAVALNLGRELLRLGHSVCIVGPRRGSSGPFRGVVEGMAVYRASSARDLLDIGAREAVDLWHCNVFARSHRPFIEAARRARWPLVVTSHLVLKDYFPFIGGVAGLRQIVGPAHHAAFVDRAARVEFLKLFPRWRGRSSVVYNGPPLRGAPAAGLRLPARPYILSVARLAPYKGQDLLLMAFAKVIEKNPSLTLLLCGRDQLKGALRAFAAALGLEKRVVFTGEVGPGAVQELLRRCEFVVHPSRRENLPLAVLEAMAAGKAVVATAAGGLPELIRHGREGLLVPPNDVASLTRRMLELCGDAALRKRLGRGALARSRDFSWRRAAAAYARLYRDALASRRRSAGILLKK